MLTSQSLRLPSPPISPGTNRRNYVIKYLNFHFHVDILKVIDLITENSSGSDFSHLQLSNAHFIFSIALLNRSRRAASSRYCAQLLAAVDEDDEIDAIVQQDRNENVSDASDDSDCVSDDDEGDGEEDDDEGGAGPAIPVRAKGKGLAATKRKTATAWRLQQIPVNRGHALDSLKALPGHSDDFGNTGPHFPRGAEKTPLSCFKLFFTGALTATIATNSNAYAADMDADINITPAELYQWLGIVLVRLIRRPGRTRAM